MSIPLEYIEEDLDEVLLPVLENIPGDYDWDMGNRIITILQIEGILHEIILKNSYKLGWDKSKELVLERTEKYLDSYGWIYFPIEGEDPCYVRPC